MIFIADLEGFVTLCGINETCSEAFYDDPDNLVEFGNEKATTCKVCLAAFRRQLKEHEKQLETFKQQQQ